MPDLIGDYVHALDRRLVGPPKLKRDMLREARDSLIDATEVLQARGLEPVAAQRRAIDEFGAVPRVAPSYQVELAATTARRLAAVTLVLPALAVLFGDRMWQGAPWSDAQPPGDYYVLIARSLDWLTVMLGVTAVLGLLGLRRRARTGADPRWLARTLGIATMASAGAVMILGMTIYGSTVALFPAALTWPPMIIGGAVLASACAAQMMAATRCLRATLAAPVAAR